MTIEKIIDFKREIENANGTKLNYMLLNQTTLRSVAPFATTLTAHKKLQDATDTYVCIYDKVYKRNSSYELQPIIPIGIIILFDNKDDIVKTLEILDKEYVNLYVPPKENIDKTIKYWIIN